MKHAMKSWICTLLCLILLAAALPVRAQTSAVLELSGEHACAGDTVTMTLSVTDAPQLSALDMVISYKQNCFTFLGAQSADPDLGLNLAASLASDGLHLSFLASQPIGRDGELIILRFRVEAAAASNSTYYFSPTIRSALDEDLQEIPITLLSGSVVTTYPRSQTVNLSSQCASTAKVGQPLTCSVYVSNANQLAAGTFTVSFRSFYLQYQNVQWGDALANAAVTVDTSTTGEIRLSFAMDTGISSAKGNVELFRLTFEPRYSSSSTSISIQPSSLYSDQLKPMGGNPVYSDVTISGADSLFIRLDAADHYHPDEVFDVPITVDANSDLAAGDLKATYDPSKLELVSCTPGTGLFMEQNPDAEAGTIRLSFLPETPLTAQTTLATLQFRIKPGIIGYTYLGLTTISAVNSTGNSMTWLFTYGKSLTITDNINSREQNRIEPTCTVDGSYEVVTWCGVCQKQLSETTVTLPALGHDFQWVTDETHRREQCTRCDAWRNLQTRACLTIGDRTMELDAPGDVTDGLICLAAYDEHGRLLRVQIQPFPSQLEFAPVTGAAKLKAMWLRDWTPLIPAVPPDLT